MQGAGLDDATVRAILVASSTFSEAQMVSAVKGALQAKQKELKQEAGQGPKKQPEKAADTEDGKKDKFNAASVLLDVEQAVCKGFGLDEMPCLVTPSSNKPGPRASSAPDGPVSGRLVDLISRNSILADLFKEILLAGWGQKVDPDRAAQGDSKDGKVNKDGKDSSKQSKANDGKQGDLALEKVVACLQDVISGSPSHCKSSGSKVSDSKDLASSLLQQLASLEDAFQLSVSSEQGKALASSPGALDGSGSNASRACNSLLQCYSAASTSPLGAASVQALVNWLSQLLESSGVALGKGADAAAPEGSSKEDQGRTGGRTRDSEWMVLWRELSSFCHQVRGLTKQPI